MQRSAPVVLKGDHDVLGIRENELSPSLPERVHNVGYEPNLYITITIMKLTVKTMTMIKMALVMTTKITIPITIMTTITLKMMTI